ncbi:MAG: RDD family protein [Planctomycetota bacterium]
MNRITPKSLNRLTCRWVGGLLVGVLAALLAGGVLGQDLPAVTDGHYVWLLEPGTKQGSDDEPELGLRYHSDGLRIDPRRGTIEMRLAKPIPGALMPRGLAAGDGRLVLVLNDRRVISLRPSFSELTGVLGHTQAVLAEFPEGCALRSLAVTERGVWALVRVELVSALESLDAADRVADQVPEGAEGFIFRSMLGLPPGADLTLPGEVLEQDPQPGPDADPSGGQASATPGEELASDPSSPEDDDTDAGPQPADLTDDPAADQAGEPQPESEGAAPDAEAEPGVEPVIESQAEPFRPVYRLIQLKQGRWQSHLLPESLGQPQQARLLARPGDAVPLMLLRYDTTPSAPIIIMRPPRGAEDPPADAPKPWATERYSLSDVRNWSAAIVQGQVVVGIERERSDTRLGVDLYLLRGERAVQSGISRLSVPTNGLARWSMLGIADRAGVFTVPGPLLQPYDDGTPAPLTLAGYRSGTLSGGVDPSVKPIMTYQPTPLEANLDWLIQIVAYAAALLLMMTFWRRTPGDGQVRLPERVELASLDKRIISGLIDLLPGLLVASAIFDVSWYDIARLWPGTPTDKSFQAMGPGLIVIGVTVVHTTAFELITARSIGKWLTGLYVADFRGKPAPPGASTVRAASRVLDMIALLLLIVPLISPARQRLGDILARTIVVTRLPDPEEEQRKREERQREREQDDDW